MIATIQIRQQFAEDHSIEQVRESISAQMEAAGFRPDPQSLSLSFEPFWADAPGEPEKTPVARMIGYRSEAAA